MRFFWRPLEIKDSLAKRATIPFVVADPPKRATNLRQPSVSPPTTESTNPILSLARRLMTHNIVLSPEPVGTVTIVDVSLTAEPAVPLAPAGTTHQSVSYGTETGTRKQDINPPPLWKRLAYILQAPAELLLSPRGTLEWPGELFPFQREGIQALYGHEALLLADDMGLGKTIQAIAALRLLIHHRRIDFGLVITPAGLVSQWRKELCSWAPELRVMIVRGRAEERAWQWAAQAHLFVTSYETVRSDMTSNPTCLLRLREWGVVVLDEAQKIKNRDTELSYKCKQIPRRRAWALTGTPMENSIDELASVLEFVCPLREGQKAPRLMAGKQLLDKQHSLQLRRKKSEVLPQLPPKIVIRISLALRPEQRVNYDRAEREGVIQLREKGEAIRVEHVLELITRLKQICNFCPTSRQSAKLDDISDRLATLSSEGNRAIIFSQFTHQDYGCRAIAASLESYRPLIYAGDMSATERDSVIQEFKSNNDRKVLILSLRAGGQGLNLQEASYVFHFDRWWNPAVENQAEDRSHRLGQRFPVHIYKYICEGTIEERIEQIISEKQLLFNELVDDISIDLGRKLTQEELFGLFNLAPPSSRGEATHSEENQTNYGSMSGEEFEQHIKVLLERKGWRAELTPRTRDAGIDVIARRNDNVGAEITLYIQCKNRSSPCGVDVVRELGGAMPKYHPGARGIVACPSGFTSDAAAWAQERGILLWDRKRLQQLAE